MSDYGVYTHMQTDLFNMRNRVCRKYLFWSGLSFVLGPIQSGHLCIRMKATVMHAWKRHF